MILAWIHVPLLQIQIRKHYARLKHLIRKFYSRLTRLHIKNHLSRSGLSTVGSNPFIIGGDIGPVQSRKQTAKEDRRVAIWKTIKYNEGIIDEDPADYKTGVEI